MNRRWDDFLPAPLDVLVVGWVMMLLLAAQMGRFSWIAMVIWLALMSFYIGSDVFTAREIGEKWALLLIVRILIIGTMSIPFVLLILNPI